jgi:hypothetical protein
MTSADIIAAARIVLKESATTIWDDTALGAYLTDAIREISNKEPLKKYVNLPVIQYTTRVDISSLTDLLRIIPQNEIEFPVGNPGYTPIYRDTLPVGTELDILLNSIPTITAGTLTGTVTFTKDSRTVTGSGTLFSTELSAGLTGSFIAHRSGTHYYQVAYITSATSLTLAEPFLETTATDTVSLTKYRANDSVARVCYGAKYTVSTTSDMPQKMDETAILGVAAKAAVALLGDYVKGDAIEVELDAADTNLTNAAAKTATANPGGDEAGKLTQIGATRVAAAQQRIAGNKNFATWAQEKLADYTTSLNKLGRPTDGAKHCCSRDL